MIVVKCWSFVCERNGTTTGKTRGQKPKPMRNVEGRPTSELDHMEANSRRDERNGVWDGRRMGEKEAFSAAVMNHEGKPGQADSRSWSVDCEGESRRRLDELNCQPMTNSPTFSQIAPRRRVILKHRDPTHLQLLVRFCRNHAPLACQSSDTSA